MGTENEFRNGSIEAAQEVLDILRASDTENLPSAANSQETFFVTPPRRAYDDAANAACAGLGDSEREFCAYRVVITYCSDTSLCPPTMTEDVRHIKAEVFYRGVRHLELETLFSRLRDR